MEEEVGEEVEEVEEQELELYDGRKSTSFRVVQLVEPSFSSNVQTCVLDPSFGDKVGIH